MAFLEHLQALAFTQNDLILFVPMALAGVVIMSALPCATRIAHYSLEACGAVAGAVVALLLIGGLPLLF
jgi:hypothetical protein